MKIWCKLDPNNNKNYLNTLALNTQLETGLKQRRPPEEIRKIPLILNLSSTQKDEKGVQLQKVPDCTTKT